MPLQGEGPRFNPVTEDHPFADVAHWSSTRLSSGSKRVRFPSSAPFILEIFMKRKRSMVLKAPSPRNPFVAVALFKKAGAHRKSEKALRRQEKVHTGSVAQMDESNRFLPGRCEFDARQVHQKNASQSEAFWNAFCSGDKAGGRFDSIRLALASSRFSEGTKKPTAAVAQGMRAVDSDSTGRGFKSFLGHQTTT